MTFRPCLLTISPSSLPLPPLPYSSVYFAVNPWSNRLPLREPPKKPNLPALSCPRVALPRAVCMPGRRLTHWNSFVAVVLPLFLPALSKPPPKTHPFRHAPKPAEHLTPVARAAFRRASRLKNPPVRVVPTPRRVAVCCLHACRRRLTHWNSFVAVVLPLFLPALSKPSPKTHPFRYAPKSVEHLTRAGVPFSRCRAFKNNPPDPAPRCPPPPRAALRKSKLSAPPSRGHKKEPLERFERLFFSTFSIIFCRNRQSF